MTSDSHPDGGELTTRPFPTRNPRLLTISSRPLPLDFHFHLWQERHYAAYNPSVGLAQRKVMAGDLFKMEMQLAAKEVRIVSSSNIGR